jgi:hypothetical protein
LYDDLIEDWPSLNLKSEMLQNLQLFT